MSVSLRDSKAVIYAELEAFRAEVDRLRIELRGATAPRAADKVCTRCDGSGEKGGGTCFTCKGTGVYPGTEAVRADYLARHNRGRQAKADAPVSARRAAMEAARAEAMRTGKCVMVAR